MKLDLDTFREIGDSLVRNKARSLLTGFGIFWGLFMLLFLKGGGDALKQMLSANFEGFATNAAVMYSFTTSIPSHGFKVGRYWDTEDSDIELLRMMFPELDVVTGIISRWGQGCVHAVNETSGNVKGVEACYSKIEEPRLKYGRYLNEADCIMERKVCVLGKRIYNDLFPDGGDPCGEFVRVGGIYYEVIGVDCNSSNMNINGRSDQSVIIPLTVAKKVYRKGKAVNLVGVTGRSGVKISALVPRIRQVLAHKHQFDPADEQTLVIINTEEIFDIMDKLFRGVNFLILLVGIGTILAGAIGVTNIMMVTVKERTTEIGIRRAIGATPLQILSQIILESVSLTLIAGCAGIVFSTLVLEGVEKIVSLSPDAAAVEFQISFGLAVISALMLVALGVVAGLAPALRAMGIKPVDAMRDE